MWIKKVLKGLIEFKFKKIVSFKCGCFKSEIEVK